jgi:hypothetical protein
LQSVAYSFGASGAVDGVSYTATCGANDTTCGLCDAADSVTKL